MARILVVDDTVEVLQTLVTVLSEAGHQIITSDGAHHALELLGRESVDLIIADIYMPDGDGLDLLRNASTVSPKTPVIAMSGNFGMHNMLPAAQYMGACSTLRKPFTQAQLLEAVAAALRAGRNEASTGGNTGTSEA